MRPAPAAWRWQAAVRKILTVASALLLASPPAFGSTEELRSCYGNSILVRLEHTGALVDIPVDLGADLSPPSRITHNAGGDVYSEWRGTCHAEPVPVEAIYVYRRHLPTPILGLGDGGPTVRRLLIRAGGSSAYDLYRERIEAAKATGDAIAVPGGLVRLEPQYDGKVGLYLTDPPQKTPSGDPLVIYCSPGVFAEECSTNYSFGNGVGLNYWFMADQVPEEEWLELDRLLRESVEKMIVKGA